MIVTRIKRANNIRSTDIKNIDNNSKTITVTMTAIIIMMIKMILKIQLKASEMRNHQHVLFVLLLFRSNYWCCRSVL